MEDLASNRGGGGTALDVTLRWASQVTTSLLVSKKRVILYTVLGALLGVTVALSVPNQYTSSATFIAQSSSSLNLPAGLLGAAASLGLDRGSDYSPKFYADLLGGRPVLRSAILHPYDARAAGRSDSANYIQIAGFQDEPPAVALDDATKHLASRVSASADVRTNMITLTVRARWPQLSHDIASQLLTALDSLNVDFRQGQSRELREFYETRVLQTRRELDSAETVVTAFLEKNRVITSPALQFDLQRLEREADRKQAVYSIVVQQYEQARLQEARNVPTLTILSPPSLPVKKSYPPRRLIAFLGALVGYLIAWAQIEIGAGLSRFRQEEPSTWAALQEQLRHVRRFR